MVISNEVFLTALICARIMHIRWWYDTKCRSGVYTGARSSGWPISSPSLSGRVFFLAIYDMFTVNTCRAYRCR
ncbi:hypothetical protein C8Q74DRAFT_317142 [Fomes fomentarius]|nr:hypothetical protein C8Q74DRAFT_317142 [Fomes fomentarius]